MADAADRLDRAEALIRGRQPDAARKLCLEVLGADQASARAWFLLGVVVSGERKLGEAARCFDRAATLDPGQARHHAQLGRCLSQLHRPAEARAAIDRALAAPGADPMALDAIGGVLSGLGDMAGALDAYRRAIEISGGDPKPLYNLGVVHQQMGDFAAAEDCYRRTIAAAPGAYQAWYALVRLRRQTAADDVLAPLERLFQAATDEVSALYVGHALAKCCEDLGDPPAALQWLARAKARRLASLPYDQAADRSLFEAAASLAAAAATVESEPDAAAPIFIVGMPRSGTTLVERVLASHSQVVSVGESPAMAVAAKQLTGIAPSSAVDTETLLALAGADCAAIGRIYAARTGAAPAIRTVDKTPLNLFYAGAIRRALPNARIVCLRRNPLDTCLANYAQLFAVDPGHYSYGLAMGSTAQRYVHFAELAGRLAATLPQDRYAEVAYEDLVAAPEPTIRRLLDFCGLAWEDACLRFHEAAGTVKTASSVQARSPLYASSVGRSQRFGEGLEAMRRVLAREGLA